MLVYQYVQYIACSQCSYVSMFQVCPHDLLVICLCLSHYNFAVCAAIIVTSSNSHNISVISSFVTLFPSLLSLSLKILLIFRSLIRGVLLLVSIQSSFLIMPPVRFFTFSWCNRLVTVILLLGEIMLLCSYCSEKELVCVIIISPTGCQPSSCIKCTRANM